MNAQRLTWLLLLSTLTACGRAAITTPVPTAIAPTATAGVAVASATHTAVPTVRATASSTATSTRRPPAPSRTPAPVASATASATPPAPTSAATQAPPPTATIALSPTPAAIINYFRIVPAEADPGDDITIEWATENAATATLWKMAPTGQFGQWWDVETSGSFAYAIEPWERNWITFALFAGDDASGYQSATATVTLRCTAEWFFANAPDICPTEAAIVSPAAWQPFQWGLMIWVQAEDNIYVLFQDGNHPQWYNYADEWDPGEPEIDPALEPPPGFYQPVRGFGLLWREEPNMRERLGWATGPEVAFTTSLQRTSYPKYNETYIAAPGGNVWRLKAERSGWELIPANP